MIIIQHRVNKINQLEKISKEYGVEIDVRGYGNKLLLTHDRIQDNMKYDELEDYLKSFSHAFIVFNLKEAGYEERVIELAKKYNIENYFLLDVEFPYLYRATRKDKFRKIAVRYSEAEPIEFVEAQMQGGKPLLDWAWIDVNTRLPLDKKSIETLSKFKTCLVCPERWGRPQDIQEYQNQLRALGYEPTAVMTSLDHVKDWENFKL